MQLLAVLLLVAAVGAFVLPRTPPRILLPLKGQQVVMLSGGDATRQYSVRLRFDLDAATLQRYGLATPALLIGSMASAQYLQKSATYDRAAGTELFYRGLVEFRLPVATGDLPARSGAVRIDADRGQANALLPMGAGGPLWSLWSSYSISADALVLGAWVPDEQRPGGRAAVSTDGRFAAALRFGGGWHAYWLRIDLSTDYTLAPLSVYTQLHDHSVLPLHLVGVRGSGAHVALVNDNVMHMRRWRLDQAATLRLNATGAQALSALSFDDAEELTLGRLDALAHFVVGVDLVSGSSALWHHTVVPVNAHGLNQYLWFALVLIATLVLWYLAMFETHWIYVLMEAVNMTEARPADNFAALLTIDNAEFRWALCMMTRVAVVATAMALLFGLRINEAATTVLVSNAYSQGCIYVAVVLAVVSCALGPRFVAQYTSFAAAIMGNALLLALWLAVSAESQLFFNSVGMMVFALVVCWRDAELVLMLLYGKLRPWRIYAPLWPLWLVLAVLHLLAAGFVLLGYSVPLFIEQQWPGNAFNPIFMLLAGGGAALLAWRNVIGSILLVVELREQRLRAQLARLRLPAASRDGSGLRL